MRLWSLHPMYLDPAGLVAAWREGLLAQKVLLGGTKGYRTHPQLDRFRACPDPASAIGRYLEGILKEAEARGYRFDGSRIARSGPCPKLRVRRGQLEHEWRHLLRKLERRSPALYERSRGLVRPRPHPLFTIIPGAVEDWERP